MKRKQTEKLKQVIFRSLRLGGLETPLNEYRAIKAWPQLAGQFIAGQTGKTELRDGKMYIKINSPALRQDLCMMRTQLTQRINQHVGANVVTDIIFY